MRSERSGAADVERAALRLRLAVRAAQLAQRLARGCGRGGGSALPGLVAQGHDVVYLVVGEGDDIPRLEALAEQHGMAERVLFKGAADLDTLVDAYRMADLFVMPSTGEGFGIVYLEAMASRTPALGLSAAGARDPLADGELGSVVVEADLAAELGRALARPRPDGTALAAEVHRRFGRETFAARVNALVDRLFEDGGATTRTH